MHVAWTRSLRFDDASKFKNATSARELREFLRVIIAAGFFSTISVVRADENIDKCTMNMSSSLRDYGLYYDYPKFGGGESRNFDQTLTIGFLGSYGRSQVVLGALPLAIAMVNENPNILPGYRLNFLAADIGRCDDAISQAALSVRYMTEMQDLGVVAFIGPDVFCKIEALVAAAWNLPLISHKCEDPEVSDRDVFDTFARTLPSMSKIGKSVVALLRAYAWNKVVVLYGTLASTSDNKLNDYLTTYGINVTKTYTITDYIPMYENKLDDIVTETYRSNRVYVFVGEHIALVDFVKCMQKRRLLYSGKYIVISVDDTIYDPRTRKEMTQRNYIDPYLPDQNMSEDIKFGFRSVLKLTPTHVTNPNFQKISDRIKEYSVKWPFCVPYHSEIFKTMAVPIQAAHLYDAVMLYARAVTELLNSGADPRNGSAIQGRIRNRSYHSIQGYDVFIDKNGDAEGNFTVITLLEDVSNGYIKRSLQPVGYFHYIENSSIDIPIFKYTNSVAGIKWVGDGPPKAEATCDFPGDLLCNEDVDPSGSWRKINDWSDWRLHLALSALIGMIAISATLAFKHYRYEQKLASILWRIELSDLTMLPNEPGDSQPNNGKNCRFETYGATTGSYTKVALYHENLVAVKKIHKKTVDLTRSIRKELKQIREVRHENLINFVGAVIEPGAIFIITTYCARGSLQDILRNNDLRLDTMFVSSLIGDLLRGMIYLHDSEIDYHGNLRSTNCLVDSRWILQVSDFGLHEFKAGQEIPNNEFLREKKMLYMAPELLRNSVASGFQKGTQKGDVYSLGIVLYETMTRRDPWQDTLMSPAEIIERIQSGEPFRPDLGKLKTVLGYVRKCIASCWQEEPDKRPDMKLVSVILKPMQSGLYTVIHLLLSWMYYRRSPVALLKKGMLRKSNIFDNMLAMMQKYACNLEDIVQERTNELMEEKDKTDALLHRMFPRPVAESLKRGEPIEAENFDSVTILFSDIVGFTELAANSTPFQVVTLLNELYTCYDYIISHYDVYKVETIGDAYMVVSGLPIKNGDNHAGEIASMALHLLRRIRRFKVPHKPGEGLHIRVGIHSGQCVAGVVGLKMPRYCLFGDTVNTASRMESSGLPLKIHMSKETWRLLQKLGGYEATERGIVYIKGKGNMKTYWLTGEDPLQRQDRIYDPATHLHRSHFGSTYSLTYNLPQN